MLRVLCCLGLFMMLFAAPAQAELKVGDAAPNFKLTGSDGKTYELSAMKGKTVIVAWYPKAFTGGCTAECKSFAKDGALLKAYDVAYFTASCDTVEENTKFAKSLETDYPILSDPTRETAKAYGLVANDKGNAKRVTFIIGADGKIADIETKVNTKEAAKQMADKLAALKVPAKK
jgi:thioredoxin-dependent peroxiredoxin